MKTPRLYTFAISHYSEKARWMLDALAMPYEEVVWTPVLHIGPALLKSRKATTVPILEVGDEVVQDSTAILEWLEANHAQFTLLPSDPETRREALGLEALFDRVGAHVIRYGYATIFESPKELVDLWTVRSSSATKSLFHTLVPAARPLLRKQFRMEPASVAKSARKIEEALDVIEARLALGRRTLVGDRLTAADITAAALLAPLACPDEHPVYSRADYRAAVAPA
ncbi:MAG: glutathione S-transferase family protein, partial [Polyangiaceae bacterium]|nr:glutathione S-transferase family protein [Polyangiaceae bacterium]